MGSVTAGQTIVQEIAVIAGQRIKVVVAWNSRSDGTTDRLMADLDLRVFDADGSVDSSLTFDNNYEWVEFIAGATGTARIEVRQSRFEDTSERYGLAWAKSNVGTPGRIAGADRYSTAATLSRAHFPAGVPVAFVATGRNFPDALAVGPVAGMQGGPVLLTDPNSLPQATRGRAGAAPAGANRDRRRTRRRVGRRGAGAPGLHLAAGLAPGGRRSVRDGGRGQPRLVRSRRAGGIHRHRPLRSPTRSPPARPRSAWAGRCCSRSRARCRRPRATSWRGSGPRGSSWWAGPASSETSVMRRAAVVHVAAR